MSWLAQAPGPGSGLQGLGVSPQNIESDQVALDPFAGHPDVQFNSAWSGYWTPLPQPSVSTNNTAAPSSTSTPNEGISIGAQAGIGASVGVIGIAILSGLGVLWRRRKSSTASQTELLPTPDHTDSTLDRKDSSTPYFATNTMKGSSGNELDVPSPSEQSHFEEYVHPVELPSHQDPQELSDISQAC